MAKKTSAKKKSGARSRRVGPEARALVSLIAELAGEEDGSPLERAQQIAWDAWDTGDRRKRISLARKALEISPLCADAYVLLALDATGNPEKALELYRKGVAVGEKALGRAAFEDDVGCFWGILETRPYMRARHGLAMTLWKLGAHDEAVAHYQDMLRLNPNDNQGIRYLLLDCLLILGRDDHAAKLLQQYKNDGSAAWLWSDALAGFRREGDCQKSRKLLTRALRANAGVADYLLGKKKLPRDLPAYISMGGEDEAIAYVADNGAMAWAAAPGSLAWVENVRSLRQP